MVSLSKLDIENKFVIICVARRANQNDSLDKSIGQ